MSDHRAWLEEWCPDCGAAPGSRCCHWRSLKRRVPLSLMHCARGWRERPCPTCKALPQERCRAPSGREASRIHSARLRSGPRELVGLWSVWEELGQRGATVALVEFWGRAGRGGQTGTITLCRREGEELVDVERWTAGRDELSYALEAPVWGRYGTFNGHPHVRGTVMWMAPQRTVVIAGHRGSTRFEETVA